MIKLRKGDIIKTKSNIYVRVVNLPCQYCVFKYNSNSATRYCNVIEYLPEKYLNKEDVCPLPGYYSFEKVSTQHGI